MSIPQPDAEQANDLIDQLGRELGTWTVLFHSAIAEQMGLNTTDQRALDLINQSGPMTAGELAEITGLTTGAVTGVIDRLEKAGFVQRAKDPHDRRKVVIERVHNPELDMQLGEAFSSLHSAVQALCASYSAQELETIRSFLMGSVRVMREETLKLRQEGGHLK